MLASPECRSDIDLGLTEKVGCFLPQFSYCRKVAYSFHFDLTVLCILFSPGKDYITLFYKNVLSEGRVWKQPLRVPFVPMHAEMINYLLEREVCSSPFNPYTTSFLVIFVKYSFLIISSHLLKKRHNLTWYIFLPIM